MTMAANLISQPDEILLLLKKLDMNVGDKWIGKDGFQSRYETVCRAFDLKLVHLLTMSSGSYNLYPGCMVPVIFQRNQNKMLRTMRWGNADRLVPYACAESVKSANPWRGMRRTRRCLVVCSG